MSSKFKILNEIFIDTNICTLYAYIFYYLIVQLFIKSIPCKWERLSSNMYCPGIFQTQILTNANGKMLFPRISRSAASFQHCFFLVGWVEWIVCVIWTACKMCGKANETRSTDGKFLRAIVGALVSGICELPTDLQTFSHEMQTKWSSIRVGTHTLAVKFDRFTTITHSQKHTETKQKKSILQKRQQKAHKTKIKSRSGSRRKRVSWL